MRKPDCILVRVGELALKSPQVQAIWFKKLKENIKAGLREEKIGSKFETNPNRLFIYTEEIEKSIEVLKRIFGIVSVSPVWTCHSSLDEIRLLAVDVAIEVLKLGPKKTFAVRSRRTGMHKFTSQIVAEEAGAAVKRVTNAKVNLSEPDYEIFTESRSRKTYIFTEKIPCAGGLPLGVSGKVLAVINRQEDILSAFLLAKRGCELAIVSNGFEKEIEILQKWHIGRRLRIYKTEDWKKIYAEEKADAITGISGPDFLALEPLVGMDEKEIESLRKKMGL